MSHTNQQKFDRFLKQSDLDPGLFKERNLPVFEDASDLVIADVAQSGREHLLIPQAAKAWMRMRNKAFMDGVSLIMVSAFRGFDRQVEIVQHSIAQGQKLEEIFKTSAPPGCSEHHSGRAIDIGTMGCDPLSQEFADTDAFDWLEVNAEKYGFKLSYPPNNPFGFDYEPWHWCFHEQT
ncbi:MAG: M15 family metallopeptidase [Gammaproteobacteria bacterium]|nr:M15 family metallopeptidase [Gammaproteobacteria bacterium]NNC98427.1 M15 family metallopeptidase [Gammaproteobacteria bacterium]NNM14734.1 M15 family metallopeptidase [Gammaproteobacteria bacterium]